MNTEIATPVKGKSWPDLVLEVPLNGPNWEVDPAEDYARPFPLEKESSIRPAISGRVKLKYPERKYTANREEYDGNTVLMVRRIE